ncbi:MAG TPA: hypothetical protein VGM77_10135 [Gemmatimonadales bacterium]|jgi:hypothetical protein
MHAPDALLHLVAPWKELYSNSKGVDTATVFVHVVALLFGGGAAVVADRATIRVREFGGDEARRTLQDLSASHRLVIIALTLSLVSGVALAAADLDTFLASPIFAIKLALVFLLVINGAFLTVTETRLREFGLEAGRATRLWGRLQLSARTSMVLWTATVLVGVALANMV